MMNGNQDPNLTLEIAVSEDVKLKITDNPPTLTLEMRKSESIKLRVLGHDNSEIYFLVKMNTQMGKLKKTYCERLGLEITRLRFLFDGRRIRDEDTPQILKMENNDVIEVYCEVTGGYIHIKTIF